MKRYIFGILFVFVGIVGMVTPIDFSSFLISLAYTAIGVLLIRSRASEFRGNNDRYATLRLDDIDNMSGLEFENYLAHLMRERGFQVQVTPGTGDFGADLIANQGDDKYAIQAKRYAVHNKVPVHAVTEAVAAVPYYDCNQAMVITSGYFTSPAITYANKVRCQLVDRDTLAVWVKESERRRRKQNQEPRVYEPPAPIELHEVVSDEEIQSGLSSWTPGSEEGYVINTGRPPRPSNVLAHKAKCHTIRGLASRRFKISVADLKSIDAWGQNHMQENPRRCGICMRSGNRS